MYNHAKNKTKKRNKKLFNYIYTTPIGSVVTVLVDGMMCEKRKANKKNQRTTCQILKCICIWDLSNTVFWCCRNRFIR